MIRGTTPTIEFNLPFDASVFSVFYITFAQDGKNVVEKNNTECKISGNKISVTLTQADTLKFKSDYIEVQIRGKTSSGEALASNIMTDHAEKVLKDGVI